DRTLKLWDAVESAERLTLIGHSSPVLGVAFSPDQQRLASAGAGGALHILGPATGPVVRAMNGPQGPGNQDAYFPTPPLPAADPPGAGLGRPGRLAAALGPQDRAREGHASQTRAEPALCCVQRRRPTPRRCRCGGVDPYLGRGSRAVNPGAARPEPDHSRPGL